MAGAVSTPGIFCLHQKQFEQQRDLNPCQEYWPNLRQPRASKRAAVGANVVGDDRRAVPASTTPSTSPADRDAADSSTLLFSALRVVMAGRGGERWLDTILELQCVCFEACKHCRELVPLRLHVSNRTPEHLWKQDVTAWKADGGSSSTSSYRASNSSDSSIGGVESDVCSEFSDDYGSEHGSGSDNGSNYGGDYGGDHGSGYGSECSRGLSQPLGWGWRRPLRVERSGLGYSLSSRRTLPAPRIAGMVWERPTMAGVSLGSDLADITFGPAVIEPLHGVAWTPGLKRLTLSSNWNLPVAGVVRDGGGGGGDIDVDENWPPLLEELVFGGSFSQPVDGIAFPASLLHLAFGEGFNHSVDLVAWPPALQTLTFGRSFNQSVERVSWPASLQRLSFGVSFDQPVAGVVWPASLRHLCFGYRFDQPVVGVVWPASLRTLSFGHDFNQPLADVVWPTSLRQLAFGFEFDQPIAGTALPASLEKISFGYCFNQPIAGVVWPALLQQLVFGGMFNHPIDGVVWPASLLSLTLGYGFMQRVENGVWPTGLSHLSVDGCFPLSRSSLPSGVRVELT